ncbi:hypothetical protein BJ742DRAFT_88368 [Cladochytrium replicatum]|nr:hypothetical protein BJ742DRAFT_88368 [Cladochytrium replicatum]
MRVHTFYLPNSRSLGHRTQYSSFGGHCTYDEDNDQYSIMGVATFCYVDHHGRYRFACGWLQSGTEVVDVTLQKGQNDCTINSPDHSYTVDGSIRLLRIPLRNTIYGNGTGQPGGTGDWHNDVEYRSGCTNICSQNYRAPIVSVRIGPAPRFPCKQKVRLITALRRLTSNVSDTPINATGGTFVDYYHGLRVFVNELGDNRVHLSIDEEPQPPSGGSGGGVCGSWSSALLVE